MNSQIQLINGQQTKNKDGYSTLIILSSVPVFADVGEPVRSQRDLSFKQGYIAKLRVKMYSFEYNDENYLKFKDKLYEIKEVYHPSVDIVELTCSDARC